MLAKVDCFVLCFAARGTDLFVDVCARVELVLGILCTAPGRLLCFISRSVARCGQVVFCPLVVAQKIC